MEKAGVYRHLGVSPYYLKPADEGLSGHFKAVADNIDGYEILYNIPGRTAGLGIPLDVSVRLAAHPRIIGQKEATGKAETAERLVKATDGMGFTVLSGDDGMTLPMMQVGAKGVISVAVNVDPKRVSRMVHLAEVGDFKGASTINNELGGLYGALFPKRTEGNTTPNPGMLYYALRRMGLDYPAPPLPITDGITTERAEVDKALRGLSLIE
jgi:4-hydroxy-tetrahydrodipicolinate synthase